MNASSSRVELHAALTRAREAAERHMTGCERDGSSWREETISELVWQAARPCVMYADFTRHQEAAVGADWLWWWVDDSGECFGMLVQAKRLHCHKNNWSIDFRANKGEQMKRLFRTAELFSVPAFYVLYMGGVDYRSSFSCGPNHHSECEPCRKAAVSVMAGLSARMASHSPRDGANAALNWSIPLEDLNDSTSEPIYDLNLDQVGADLRAFLLEGQTGARKVAQMLFRKVSAMRDGMFSLDVAEQASVDSDVIFQNLPLDMAHFGVPYFDHILRGLRHNPPAYVQDILAGQEPPQSVTRAVGGIAVIRC
jgi:hypothetical protein